MAGVARLIGLPVHATGAVTGGGAALAHAVTHAPSPQAFIDAVSNICDMPPADTEVHFESAYGLYS